MTEKIICEYCKDNKEKIKEQSKIYYEQKKVNTKNDIVL